ncbi:sulfur oxidation c-type cytochrome SoxX [Calidifontimicrobium sp. SYSU G02091]|uniref:sulfur oxidation c-type cytochrome SoxX n=1 Tax=Calidifontimicrobium sp. SYSU G02091 TaxID=2926421 RepID=UPI001F5320F7|nr:sulfur oxidation c-type cytochrome SoxX [Calidifontimicrobium sp. SYSU G02091]MCI1191372.1 sulfur oxidation c-type cytochrome SoxX [Calidifontimicrobium sp. SYSU G02091]
MTRITLTAAAVAVVLAGCASGGPDPKALDEKFARLKQTDFQPRGIATMDRLNQDEAQKLCSDPAAWGGKEFEAARKKVEEINLASIKWPSDGKFLGDWKQGEAIAQSGRGLTWTDDAKTVNGGNCYNCHQIDKKEISHGTIGPSLWNYGKLRGVTDPNSPASQEIVKYTWGKIWNAKAYNACSNMPRAGHMGILNEQQIKHVMALLLDPKSPVNQ